MPLTESCVLFRAHSPTLSDFMLFVPLIVFELFYSPTEIEVNL